MLGEANRTVTARLPDGWVPFNISLPALEAAIETMSDAVAAAGRSPMIPT